MESFHRVEYRNEEKRVVPPRCGPPGKQDGSGQGLHDLIIIVGIEMPQVVPVNQVDYASFAAQGEQVLMRRTGALRGQEHGSPGAEVEILVVEKLFVVGREVIEYG